MNRGSPGVFTEIFDRPPKGFYSRLIGASLIDWIKTFTGDIFSKGNCGSFLILKNRDDCRDRLPSEKFAGSKSSFACDDFELFSVLSMTDGDRLDQSMLLDTVCQFSKSAFIEYCPVIFAGDYSRNWNVVDGFHIRSSSPNLSDQLSLRVPYSLISSSFCLLLNQILCRL